MRLAAVAATAALVCGCLPISYRGGWVLTATGAVVGVVGAGVAAESDGKPTHGTLAIGALPGAIILAIGLFVVLENRPPPPEPPEERAAREAAARQHATEMFAQQREAAWQLTKEAQQAARDGNCARVLEIDPNVQAMDAELYASTFITDIAIQRCIGSPVR